MTVRGAVLLAALAPPSSVLLGANVPPPPPPTPIPALPAPAASAAPAQRATGTPAPRASATPAERAPSETVTAFLARVDAAAKAARPASEIEISTVTTGGLSGEARVVRRGDDYFETDTFGPIVTERGSLDGKRWHQTANGVTVLDDPQSLAGPVPVSQSLMREQAPRDAFVVSQTLPDGRVHRTTYDATSLVKVAEETTRGTHYARIAYDDIRPYGTGRRAWHAKGGDDRGNRYESTIESDDAAAAVDPATLAIPPNRRALVEFPPGLNQTALPARVENGRIHVKVEIDGSPFWFVLDSGAAGIVVDDAVVKALKLPAYGSASLTVAGTFGSTQTIAPVVRVGSLLMRDVVMRTAPIDSNEGTERVVGLLGFDFIANTVLRIDYVDPGGVEAVRPGAFLPPPLATASAPVRLSKQVPVVSVGAGDSTANDMIVDTGAEAPVIFFDRFVKSHPAAVSDEGTGGGYDPGQNVLLGVGGRVPIVPLRIHQFTFADLEFKNYLVLRAAEAGAFGDDSDDGLLGALFLRFYTLYIDYPDRKLYFEPNQYYRDGVGKPIFLP